MYNFECSLAFGLITFQTESGDKSTSTCLCLFCRVSPIDQVSLVLHYHGRKIVRFLMASPMSGAIRMFLIMTHSCLLVGSSFCVHLLLRVLITVIVLFFV